VKEEGLCFVVEGRPLSHHQRHQRARYQSFTRASIDRPTDPPRSEDATDDERGVGRLDAGAVHVARVEGVETRSSSWRTKRGGFEYDDVNDDDDDGSAATRRGSKNERVVDDENDDDDGDGFG